MVKPEFQKLWDNFPDHARYPSLFNLYTMLGGAAAKNINAPGFGPSGNACASRMSVAMNLAGHRIDDGLARAALARTLGTDRGYRIIYGVADLRAYLLRAFGKPSMDNASPFDDNFAGKKGIIAFGVKGWSGATGHIALYDGTSYREPEHDDYSRFSRDRAETYRGEFWEMA